MNGGEIKNVLTLDVSKFDASVKRVTAQLDKLDARLEKVGQVASQLDKGVSALSEGMGAVTGGFQILNSVVGDVGKRMTKASAGVDRIGQSSKKAAAELTKLAGSAEKMESMADWVNHYGKALSKLNPLIGQTTKSHQQMDKEFMAQAKNAKKSQVEVVQARTKALAAERAANAQAIKDRRKMLEELAKIEERAQVTAQFHTTEANRYFGKNKSNPKRGESLALAQAASAEANAAAEQRKNIQAIVKELTWKNAQLRAGVIESMHEVRNLRELAALDAERARHQRALAAAAKQYRQEKKQEAADNKALDRQVKRVLGSATVPGNSAAASASVFSAYFADQDAKWAKHYKDIERGAAKTAKHVKGLMKEITIPAQTLDQRQSFYESLWGDNGSVARAAKAKADEEIRQSKRAEQERIRAARNAARIEKAEALEVAQTWKTIGTMYAGMKIAEGGRAGVHAASDYQLSDLRLKLFNMPEAEYSEAKSKALNLSREVPMLSVQESLRLRADAISALGKNYVGEIDAMLPNAAKAALSLKAGGYDTNDTSNIIKNLFGVIEMRQQQYDPEAAKRTIDLMMKTLVVSQGKVTIADVETYMRNAGAGGRQISDEGLAKIVPMLEMFKTAGGGNGGGGGVARVGNMVKMLSAYANGKTLKNEAVMQLLGAGVMNDQFSKEDMDQFRSVERANIEMMKALKHHGFKNTEGLLADPMAFMIELREPLLKYMTQPENIKDFFGNVEKFSYNDKGRMVRDSDGAVVDKINQGNIEGQAFHKFLNRMGMSQGAIDGMLSALNIVQIERNQNVSDQLNKAAGAEQAFAEVIKTWSGSVDALKANAESLAAAFEPVLSAMSDVVKMAAQGVGWLAEFVKESDVGLLVGTMAIAGAAILTFNLTLGTFFRALRTLAGGKKMLTEVKDAIDGLSKVGAAKGLAEAGGKIATVGAAIDGVGKKSKFGYAWLDKLAGGIDGVGAKATVARGAVKGVGLVLSALGGPFGIAAGLLITGAALWYDYAKAANKASKEAADSFREVLSIKEKMDTEGDSAGIGSIEKLEADREKQVAEYQKALERDRQVGQTDTGKLSQKSQQLLNRIQATDQLLERARKAAEGKSKVTLKRTDGTDTEDLETVNPKDLKGKPKKKRGDGSGGDLLEKNAYQISLEQLLGDARMAQLDAEGIASGSGADMKAKAEAAFIKAWMGGVFDDNKRKPQDRPMALGSFNKETGWKRENIDLNHPDALKWMEAFTQKESAQSLSAGLSFAQGKAEAAAEGAAQALAKLTDSTNGQTASFNELLRGFARYEGQNPAIRNSEEYQSSKRDALTNKAVEEYANEADAIKRRLEEKRIEMSDMSDLDQQIAKARLVYQTEMDRLSATENMLRIQIKAYEDAGKTTDENYLRAKGILESMTPIYEEQRQILQRSLQEASKTAVGKTFEEWQKLENSYNTLATGWLNNVADTLTGVAVGEDKIDLKNFAYMVTKDLTGMFIKSGIASIGQGIMGDGTQSLFKMTGDLIKGNPLGGGGWLASAINGWTGNTNSGKPGLTSGMGDALSTTAVTGVAENVGLGAMFSDLTARLQSFGASIFTAEDGVVSGLGGMFASVKDGLGSFVTSLFNSDSALGKFASTILDNVMSALSSLFNSIGGGAGGGGFGSMLASAGSWVASFFADGGSFDKGGLHAFAKGGAFTNGIYSSPTFFKFAKGGSFADGVMGEAGPEAVMPLSRDSSGRLGVAVQGGMGGGSETNVTIQINVSGDGTGGSTKSTGSEAAQWKVMANKVKGLVVQEIINQKRPGGALA